MNKDTTLPEDKIFGLKETESLLDTVVSIDVEKVKDKVELALIEKPPVWPFSITSPYGKLRKLQHYTKAKIHPGIDFVGFKDNMHVISKIKAGVHGTVVFAKMEAQDTRGKKWGGRGNCITIRSTKNPNVYFCYYHLAQIYVKENTIVTPDTEIALMGNSGASLGGHLHFEVKLADSKASLTNGIPYPSNHVDPSFYYIGDFNKQSKVIDIHKMETLKEGDKGADVEFMQELLVAKGYRMLTDGQFGASTKEIVIEFQKEAGIQADGIVGPGTWSKLI